MADPLKNTHGSPSTTYSQPPPHYNNGQPYSADTIGTQPTSYYGGPVSEQGTGTAHSGYYGPGNPVSPVQNERGTYHEMEQPHQAPLKSQEAYGNSPQQQTFQQGPSHGTHPQQQNFQQQSGPGYGAPPAGQHSSAAGQPPMAQNQHQKYQTSVPIANLQAVPCPVDCPNCKQRTLTHTRHEAGSTTHAWALGLCLLTCLGCIPYCISGTKDVVHNCGNCGCNLATWHRSGRTDVHMYT